jgi:hypothetical protein
MKRLVGLFARVSAISLLLAYLPQTAEAQTVSWTSQFGSTDNDIAWGVATDPSGVYVTGNTFGALPGQTSAGFSDGFLRKYDSAGNELWTRQFGGAGDDVPFMVATDATGVYVVGRTYSDLLASHAAPSGIAPRRPWLSARATPLQASNDEQAFLRKFDTNGSLIWTREFGTTRGDDAIGVASDGTTVYVTGTTDDLLHRRQVGGTDVYVRAFDINGIELWTRQFGSRTYDFTNAVAADATGVYVTGFVGGKIPGQIRRGSGDAFVRKFSPTGIRMWTQQFGTSEFDEGWAIATDGTGASYVLGDTGGQLHGQTAVGRFDVFVRKFRSGGTVEWTSQFGAGIATGAGGIATDGSRLVVAGYTLGAFDGTTNSGGYDVFVRELGLDGVPRWTTEFGSDANDFAYWMTMDSHGIYPVGYTQGTLPGQTSSGGDDAFIAGVG